MLSGIKNAVVDIMQKTATSVDADYNTPVYAITAWKEDVFCEATPRRGREVAIDGEVVAESYIRFRFEFFDVEGITSEMWLVHEGMPYNIRAILPDISMKKFTEIEAV